MTESIETMERLARRVEAALGSADLDTYRDLLDPNVRWGPPDDPASGCHDRDQVLAWYRRGRQAGARAKVTEVTVVGDRLLVGLEVTGRDQARRWQVLAVREGRVVEIVGYEDRDEPELAAR